DVRPIVATGPLQIAVIEAETEPADQVQRHIVGRTQPRDVPRVRRNLGFPKCDVQHRLARQSTLTINAVVVDSTWFEIPIRFNPREATHPLAAILGIRQSLASRSRSMAARRAEPRKVSPTPDGVRAWARFDSTAFLLLAVGLALSAAVLSAGTADLNGDWA